MFEVICLVLLSVLVVCTNLFTLLLIIVMLISHSHRLSIKIAKLVLFLPYCKYRCSQFYFRYIETWKTPRRGTNICKPLTNIMYSVTVGIELASCRQTYLPSATEVIASVHIMCTYHIERSRCYVLNYFI